MSAKQNKPTVSETIAKDGVYLHEVIDKNYALYRVKSHEHLKHIGRYMKNCLRSDYDHYKLENIFILIDKQGDWKGCVHVKNGVIMDAKSAKNNPIAKHPQQALNAYAKKSGWIPMPPPKFPLNCTVKLNPSERAYPLLHEIVYRAVPYFQAFPRPHYVYFLKADLNLLDDHGAPSVLGTIQLSNVKEEYLEIVGGVLSLVK